MAFTYDVSTRRGKVRLLIADTQADEHDFEDEEVDAALSMQSNSIKKSASFLLMALANDRARLSVSYKRGSVDEDLTQIAMRLRLQAQQLYKEGEDEGSGPLIAVVNPSVDAFQKTKNELLDRDGDVEEAP